MSKYNVVVVLLFYVLLCLIFTSEDGSVDFTSTYPDIGRYFKNIIDPLGNCPNFVCNYSSLSSSQIDAFVDRENKMRAEYAKAHQVSNMYRVELMDLHRRMRGRIVLFADVPQADCNEIYYLFGGLPSAPWYWDTHLAEFARKKVQMCLPGTFVNKQEQYLIYDEHAADSIFSEESPVIGYPSALQILIADRSESVQPTTGNRIIFQAKLIDYYLTLFYSQEESFDRRSSTTLVGCGYIFQQFEDSFTDRIVCAYGMFYLEAAYAIEKENTPCSKCDFYKYEYYSDPRTLAKDRHEVWGCDHLYTTLCADLNRKPILQYEPSNFNCTDPRAGLEDDGFGKIIHQPPHNTTPEVVPIPCWYITAPLGVIILIVMLCCLFHCGTACITYFKTKKT